MPRMRELATIDAEIAEVDGALSKAYVATGYAQGDRSVQRERIRELQLRRATLQRERDERVASDNGVTNPMVMSASWVR